MIGASGNTCKVIAELALNQGHDLRATVRNTQACADLAAGGTEVFAGDLDQRDTGFDALINVDDVYS